MNTYKHPLTHDIKFAPKGFSLLVLFLGALIPFTRKDTGMFFYMLITQVVCVYLIFLASLKIAIIIYIPMMLFYAFTYNREYAILLEKEGYYIIGSQDL